MGTGIAVLQTIKRSAKQMSAKTKYMQSQMNRVLIAEVSANSEELTKKGSGRIRHDSRRYTRRYRHVPAGLQRDVRWTWYASNHHLATHYV